GWPARRPSSPGAQVRAPAAPRGAALEDARHCGAGRDGGGGAHAPEDTSWHVVDEACHDDSDETFDYPPTAAPRHRARADAQDGRQPSHGPRDEDGVAASLARTARIKRNKMPSHAEIVARARAMVVARMKAQQAACARRERQLERQRVSAYVTLLARQ